VRCIGGPDEVHVLSELAPATLAAIDAWITGATVTANTDELHEVCDFLRAVGAIDAPSDGAPLAWIYVGSEKIGRQIEQAFGGLPAAPATDLTIVVRSRGTLRELVERTQDSSGRQLLLDLTGHHTISLGPFVTPRFTSCIECYARRLTNRWGDDQGPATPASSRWTAVAAELLAIQTELIARRASPLVNRTMSWDLQDAVATRDDLLRAIDCSRCARATSGALSTPPAQSARQNESTPSGRADHDLR